MTRTRWSILVAVVTVVGLAWIWGNRVRPRAELQASLPPAPAVGHPAPDFALITAAGDTLALSALAGSPIVLNFWATWCPPCRAEAPELEAAHRRYAGEVAIIGIDQAESAAEVLTFAAQLGLSYPMPLDSQAEVSRRYAVRSLPTTFFIDRTGVIRQVANGPVTEATLTQLLKAVYNTSKDETSGAEGIATDALASSQNPSTTEAPSENATPPGLPMLQLGRVAIPTYPLALLLAGWIALEVGARAARRLGLDGDHIYNVGLYGLFAGLIAGRTGHVIAFWPAYRTQPVEIIGLNTRAFLLWPGIAGGLVVAGWYISRHRLSWSAVMDALAPGVLAGMAVASLGGFVAGQALGAPTQAPFGVSFWDVPRHPIQIYEAAAALALLAVIWPVLRSGVRAGTTAWIGLLGCGLSFWLLEPLRAESATMLGGIRILQVVGLVAALVALWRFRPGEERRKVSRSAL